MSTMLDKLSDNMHDRHVIEEFLEWLQNDWLQSQEKYTNDRIIDIHIPKVLDEYHGIDRKELERERRALLKQLQQSQRKPLTEDEAAAAICGEELARQESD